jgi:hypothetical protein
MSEISIKTCKHCSNYDALEAIMGWMLINYSLRNYQREREIKVKSGALLRVTEIKSDDELKNCDGHFLVEKVRIRAMTAL